MKKFLTSKKNPFNLLGPGFITGAADDDPSGIATYSQTGAQFGTTFLWLAPFTFPLMAIVQEMCARIGLVTGKGLASNIRTVFPKNIVLLLTGLLFVANTINIGADLGAMAASVKLLFPTGGFIAPLLGIAVLSLLLQIFMPYRSYAKYLKWLAFVLVFYAISALAAGNVNWGEVITHTIYPVLPKNGFFILTAVLGTTISPYLFFWQTSQEIEEEIDKGQTSIKARKLAISPRSLKDMRIDVWVGMFFSNLAMFFIILATAVTLFASGITNISSAADAANALKPFLGNFAYLVFTLGIIGTGMLAVPVLAGSSAYAISEIFRKKEGLSKTLKQAAAFYGVIIVSMCLGVLMNFLGINPIKALLWSAVANGIVAPFILASIVIISSKKKIMGAYVNNSLTKYLGWGVTAIMVVAVMATLLSFF